MALLLNDRGEVIGIVVAKINAMQLAKTMGAIPERINFAIPVDEARSMILMAYPAGFTPSNRTASLRDQQIFAQSKDATVLILAPKETHAESQQTAKSQPSPDEPSSEVFAMPNKEVVTMKPTLLAFVEAFIQSGASDQLDSVMQFYAPKVNYYDEGVVDEAFIRRDISELRRRWPRREYQLLRKPVARAGPNPNQYLVNYRIGYTLANRRSEARGISNVTILVQDDDGTYSVLAVREINEKNDSPSQ